MTLYIYIQKKMLIFDGVLVLLFLQYIFNFNMVKIWISKICNMYLICGIFLLTSTIRGAKHPEADLSFEDRVRRHGYPIEIHQVVTEDDYILSLYRIPHGLQKSPNESTNKSAVILVHGNGGAPHNFIVLGKKDSIAYYLADRGFDVWLLCARGVEGSFKKKHKKYDWDKDQKYWDYSLHEIGLYDLRADIDYILAHTNQSKVFYIGHSAGGPQFFILLSEKPEYNDKIKLSAQYASGPILKRFDYAAASFLCSLVDILKGLYRYMGLVEFLPQLQILTPTFKVACADPNFRKICIYASWIVGSHQSILMEDDLIGNIASIMPPRLSTKQTFHYMDNINFGEFRKYHYGTKKNMRIYGQKLPPKYNLSRSMVPVAFFYGAKDSLCVKLDIYEAMNEMPNVVLDYEVPFKHFTHLDFIFARNATNLVYEPTYKLFKDYDEGRIPERISKRSIPDVF